MNWNYFLTFSQTTNNVPYGYGVIPEVMFLMTNQQLADTIFLLRKMTRAWTGLTVISAGLMSIFTQFNN